MNHQQLLSPKPWLQRWGRRTLLSLTYLAVWGKYAGSLRSQPKGEVLDSPIMNLKPLHDRLEKACLKKGSDASRFRDEMPLEWGKQLLERLFGPEEEEALQTVEAIDEKIMSALRLLGDQKGKPSPMDVWPKLLEEAIWPYVDRDRLEESFYSFSGVKASVGPWKGQSLEGVYLTEKEKTLLFEKLFSDWMALFAYGLFVPKLCGDRPGLSVNPLPDNAQEVLFEIKLFRRPTGTKVKFLWRKEVEGGWNLLGIFLQDHEAEVDLIELLASWCRLLLIEQGGYPLAEALNYDDPARFLSGNADSSRRRSNPTGPPGA